MDYLCVHGRRRCRRSSDRYQQEAEGVRKGQVPIYKFCWNDGFVVMAREAARIAEAMTRQDLFTLEFLTAHFPRFDPANYHQLGRTRELVALWIAFNRVAAANDGYTIK